MASIQPPPTQNSVHPQSSPTPSTPTEPQSPLYLIRLSQSHESFRLPELYSLATYLNTPLRIHHYSPTSPFCIVSFPSTLTTPDPTHTLAAHFISRSILSKGIYHLYSSARTYQDLHDLTRSLPPDTWRDFETVSFKFSVDAYRGKRSMAEQRGIVEGFGYLPFRGRIRMSGAEEEFVVFEEWEGLDAEGHAMLREGGGDKKGVGENGSGELVNGEGHDAVPFSTSTSITLSTTPPNDPNGTTPAPAAAPSSKPSIPHTHHPTAIYFARHLSNSSRHLIEKHDLKKRPYISTTSMDAELALLTCTLAHIGPGTLTLDPFVGTGGFMVAAAELGAIALGSDIDGRSFRGKGRGVEGGVLRNFRRYGIESGFGDCVTCDLTNSPFRMGRQGEKGGRAKSWLDAVVCDPPYGVREGLKVLGRRRGNDGETEESISSPPQPMNGHGEVRSDTGLPTQTSTPLPPSTTAQPPPPSPPGPFLINGIPSHTLPGFIAPKRPYSFNAMLLDILDFAARTLVTGGRLAFWMPCANEVGTEEFGIPVDPRGLVILRHVCVQEFNRWSRRLLVYERVVGEIEDERFGEGEGGSVGGRGGGRGKADELNQFRRMYFQGFNREAGVAGDGGG